jgi:hypothetical protein
MARKPMDRIVAEHILDASLVIGNMGFFPLVVLSLDISSGNVNDQTVRHPL